MYRKELIDLLKKETLTAQELAKHFDVKQKDIEDELEHIFKSIKKEGMKLKITPAQCRKCGFTFKRDKMDKPGKCPECKGTWIAAPRFHIE